MQHQGEENMAEFWFDEERLSKMLREEQVTIFIKKTELKRFREKTELKRFIKEREAENFTEEREAENFTEGHVVEIISNLRRYWFCREEREEQRLREEREEQRLREEREKQWLKGSIIKQTGGMWYPVVAKKALGKKQTQEGQAKEEAMIAEKLRELEATDQEISEMRNQRLKAEDELRAAKKECEMLMDEIRRRRHMAKTRLRKEQLGSVSEELSHRKAVQKRAEMRSAGCNK